MHEIYGGSDLRPHDDYGISLPLVGQHLVFAFSLAHCGSAGSDSVSNEPFSLLPGEMIIVSPCCYIG